MQKAQNGPSATTAEKLAKEHGVGKNTVKRAGQYAEAVARSMYLALVSRVCGAGFAGGLASSKTCGICSTPFFGLPGDSFCRSLADAGMLANLNP
ncbi:MAG: hypothetical protein WA108_13115, partial [Thiobacillus sp.]